MSLQQTLSALKTAFESGNGPIVVPDWVHERMRRATSELIDSKVAEQTLQLGDNMPSFRLTGADGAVLDSTELLAKGPLIISFYRGVWCPYCNIELKALQAILPDIIERGAQLVAISPQTTSNSRKSCRDNGLTFPILTDPSNEVAARFGLRWTLPTYLREVYLQTFHNDLTVINGDKSWTLPMPARYVVNPEGIVVSAEVNPDYTQRPEPSDLLPILDLLVQSATSGKENYRA